MSHTRLKQNLGPPIFFNNSLVPKTPIILTYEARNPTRHRHVDTANVKNI